MNVQCIMYYTDHEDSHLKSRISLAIAIEPEPQNWIAITNYKTIAPPCQVGCFPRRKRPLVRCILRLSPVFSRKAISSSRPRVCVKICKNMKDTLGSLNGSDWHHFKQDSTNSTVYAVIEEMSVRMERSAKGQRFKCCKSKLKLSCKAE